MDGGVFANNPALCAYVEARTLFPEHEDILLVSLGTEELTRRLPHDEVAGWEVVQWSQPILSVVFDGVSDTVSYQLKNSLPDRDGAPRHYRFQTDLTEGNDDMDDASRTNLRALRVRAQRMISDHVDEIDDLCEALTA